MHIAGAKAFQTKGKAREEALGYKDFEMFVGQSADQWDQNSVNRGKR